MIDTSEEKMNYLLASLNYLLIVMGDESMCPGGG